MAIEFIYFDVGGVSMLDFSGTNKWKQLTQDLGVREEDYVAFTDWFAKYENEVNVGRDIETLVPMFEQKFGIQAPPNYSFLWDFVNRFEANPSIHPIMRKLKKDYPLGLLTNMYPGMLNAIKSRKLLLELEYNLIIDSSIVGYQKPDPKIFEIAENKAQVKPENIFFVDNRERHVETAKSRGWTAYLYNSAKLEESNQGLVESLRNLVNFKY